MKTDDSRSYKISVKTELTFISDIIITRRKRRLEPPGDVSSAPAPSFSPLLPQLWASSIHLTALCLLHTLAQASWLQSTLPGLHSRAEPLSAGSLLTISISALSATASFPSLIAYSLPGQGPSAGLSPCVLERPTA